MSSGALPQLNPIGLLLADDSKFMLGAIREVLQTEPRISILEEATNFADLAKMVADLKPEVAVVDVHMPGKRQSDSDDLKRLLANCSAIAISVWDDAFNEGNSEAPASI